MTLFFLVILIPLVVLPIGVLSYYIPKRIHRGRGFSGRKGILLWSFILPGLPFFIVILSKFISLLVYYDEGKPILSAIIIAPVTFFLSILMSVLYMISISKEDKITYGFISLMVGFGCIALSIYLLFFGPSLS